MLIKTKTKFGALGAFFLLVSCTRINLSSFLKISEPTYDSSGIPVPICLVPSSWVPNVKGIGAQNNDSNVHTSTQEYSAQAPIYGLADSIAPSGRAAFDFTLEALGKAGSVSLTATPARFPNTLQGSAFPVLVSLFDGTREWIQLDPSCFQSGFFTCAQGKCQPKPQCQPGSQSVYRSRDDWEQHQILPVGYTSNNRFPHCQSLPTGSGSIPCTFDSILSNGQLPSGNYRAEYVLLSSHYATTSGKSADIKLSITKKKDQDGSSGTIALNFIFVGTENVEAARSEKGQQNLNLLTTAVAGALGRTPLKLKIGKVAGYEWDCGNGDRGDAFSDPSIAEAEALIATATKSLPVTDNGKSISVMMVSSLLLGDDPTVTFLGFSGAIGGPSLFGFGSSGVMAATFDSLATYNANCTPTQCTVLDQDKSFIDLGNTVSHEIGHYLGLNHPSEKDGLHHDFLNDTPTCGPIGNAISVSSCLSIEASGPACHNACPNYFGNPCPDVSECQFNHLMWFQSKNLGDGQQISQQSSGVIHYDPLVQ